MIPTIEDTKTPSYCFNISAPTSHDQELEDLRGQLIFWVEGKKNVHHFVTCQRLYQNIILY